MRRAVLGCLLLSLSLSFPVQAHAALGLWATLVETIPRMIASYSGSKLADLDKLAETDPKSAELLLSLKTRLDELDRLDKEMKDLKTRLDELDGLDKEMKDLKTRLDKLEKELPEQTHLVFGLLAASAVIVAVNMGIVVWDRRGGRLRRP